MGDNKQMGWAEDDAGDEATFACCVRAWCVCCRWGATHVTRVCTFEAVAHPSRAAWDPRGRGRLGAILVTRDVPSPRRGGGRERERNNEMMLVCVLLLIPA